MSIFPHLAIRVGTLLMLVLGPLCQANAASNSYLQPQPRHSVSSDNAQALVRIWTGTWSGLSYGRNNPGQPQPTAPVGGTWILDLQAVDTVNNTAAGTLTWVGKDAYWTYVILPNGTFTATPHDFIPNRTIQFNNTNTTLISPASGAGPQFHLTIEGFKNKPNPSDAFYGPWFSVDLFPASGIATSAGVGFSAHPYNPENFDTAFSNGTASGSTNICPGGMLIPNVRLPEVTVPLLVPTKPWQIRYGELGLNFTTVTPPLSALCEGRSNLGSLNVMAAPSVLGPFLVFAHSVASATVTTFKGSTVGFVQPCSFLSTSGPRNDCLLNGPFEPDAYYARWHSDGFTTEVNVLRLAGEPDFLRTGPLNFWVNLNKIQLSPATKSFESIIRGVEPFVHTELIKFLPLITVYAIIQDPGKVTLFVVKDGILGTGVSPQGTVVTDIPRSVYYQSDTNPAVILIEPDGGNYKIFVNGVATGDYSLSVSTTKLPENTSQAAMVNGNTTQGGFTVYDLSLTRSSGTTTQIFNSTPVSFPPIQLLELHGQSPPPGAVLDSILQTRDPFPLVNATNVINPGATRLQLLASYLRLSPGEPITAVSAEAIDAANQVFSLTVEDVRAVRNTALSQVTVRLSESLPAGRIQLRLRLHGQLTNAVAIMIQK